jgi:hypothetical protein
METVPMAQLDQDGKCPYCGAKNQRGVQKCWLCGTDVTAMQAPPPRGTFQWDWEVLLAHERDYSGPSMWVALICVGVVLLGFLLEWPGLGIFLAFLLTPVLVRSLVAMGKESRRRIAFGVVALSSAIGTGAIILLATICAPVGIVFLSGYILWSIIGVVSVGISAAVYELYSLYRLRPRKDKS